MTAWQAACRAQRRIAASAVAQMLLDRLIRCTILPDNVLRCLRGSRIVGSPASCSTLLDWSRSDRVTPPNEDSCRFETSHGSTDDREANLHSRNLGLLP